MSSPVIAEFLGQLLRVSWRASILALVVGVVLLLLGKHLDARWRCRLWWLVIIRLAWPDSLPTSVSLFNWVGIPPGFEVQAGTAVPVLTPSLQRFLESPGVVWVWGGVAVALFLRTLLGWLGSLTIRWKSSGVVSPKVHSLLQECQREARWNGSITVAESKAVQSPCLLGVWRPHLVLPQGLVGELNPVELRLVFLHELAHLRRRDLALNWLLALVEAIHWYNPLVWHVTRQLRAEREQDCDARVLKAQPDAGRAYGEVLLKLMGRASPSGVPTAGQVMTAFLGFPEEDIRPQLRRLRALRERHPRSRPWLVGSCAWMVLFLVGFTDAEPTALRTGRTVLERSR